jgi:hypothetical protein
MLAAWWRPALILVLGFGIHWIPESFKLRYRTVFAELHPALHVALGALAVLVAYQFMAAESQPFIYFQF